MDLNNTNINDTFLNNEKKRINNNYRDKKKKCNKNIYLKNHTWNIQKRKKQIFSRYSKNISFYKFFWINTCKSINLYDIYSFTLSSFWIKSLIKVFIQYKSIYLFSSLIWPFFVSKNIIIINLNKRIIKSTKMNFYFTFQ